MIAICSQVLAASGATFYDIPVKDIEGKETSLAPYKGKVLLIVNVASNCGYTKQYAGLQTIYEKYKGQGFETLAVAMSYDPPSYVVNFTETRKLPFKVAIDNTGAVAKAWGDVKLTPTTYIVNKRGEIVKSYIGAPDFEELHKLIERLLAEA